MSFSCSHALMPILEAFVSVECRICVTSGNIHSVMVLFILTVQVRVLEKFKEVMFLEYTLTMFSSSRILEVTFPTIEGTWQFCTIFIRTYCWILSDPDESSHYPHTLFRNLTAAIEAMTVKSLGISMLLQLRAVILWLSSD